MEIQVVFHLVRMFKKENVMNEVGDLFALIFEKLTKLINKNFGRIKS